MADKLVKTIGVHEKGEIKVSQKSKKSYFGIKEADGTVYLCWDTSQYNDFVVGSNVNVEVTPSKNPQYSSSITLVKPEVTKAVAPPPAKVPQEATKSTPKEVPIDKMARSTSLAYAKDCWCATASPGDEQDLNAVLAMAEVFYNWQVS